MGLNLDRLTTRVTRAVARSEREYALEMRAYIQTAHARLQEDLRRGWPDRLRESSRVWREARARELLAQVQPALDALRLDNEMGPAFRTIQAAIDAGTRLEAEQSRAIFEAYARSSRDGRTAAEIREFITGPRVPWGAIEDQTRNFAQGRNTLVRLHNYTEEAFQKINTAVVNGLVRGDGYRKVAREVRRAVIGEPVGRGGLAYQAETIARTELLSSLNVAKQERLEATGITEVVWVATADERVCFPAGTMVSTPDGEREIESLRPGDVVLTRDGPHRVARTMRRRYDGAFVRITAGGRSLTATVNHPVWTTRGWQRADALRAGDTLQNAAKQRIQVDDVHHVMLRNAANGDAVPFADRLVASGVALPVLVPVRAVDFQRGVDVGQVEIDAPATEAAFLLERDAEPVQARAHDGFKARLAAMPAVAGDAAEARGVSRAWRRPLRFTAPLAREQVRRASAFLAAMRAVLALLRPHGSATAHARAHLALRAARVRADGVPIGERGGDGERTAAGAARFRHHLRLAGRVIARATAPAARAAHVLQEHAAAVLARGGALRASPVMAAGVGAVCAGSADVRMERRAADHARGDSSGARHDSIIPPRGAVYVYNLSIDTLPEYYANGVLVHNCHYCGARSGNVYKLSDVIIPAHPRCRCTTAPFKREWVEAGVLDMGDLRQHRADVLAEYRAAVGDEDARFSTGATPFERSAGRERPRPRITV